MTIDISQETLISLAQAPKSLPGRPHISTLSRWHTRGIRGICLETLVIGGKRYTSQQALQRFAEATTAAANADLVSNSPSSSKARARSVAAAEAELDAAGI